MPIVPIGKIIILRKPSRISKMNLGVSTYELLTSVRGNIL